jgi:catechol 2,3-dioxygenase-like lactoylglutathione lyase family enzyme
LRVVGVDHIQLAMPSAGEDKARAFYSRLLEMPEVPKPPDLAKRGGVWFESSLVKIHLGVDPDFRPARKAHPGLLVEGVEELVARIRAAGYEVIDELLDGRLRAFVHDPFGNRLELIDGSRGHLP